MHYQPTTISARRLTGTIESYMRVSHLYTTHRYNTTSDTQLYFAWQLHAQWANDPPLLLRMLQLSKVTTLLSRPVLKVLHTAM